MINYCSLSGMQFYWIQLVNLKVPNKESPTPTNVKNTLWLHIIHIIPPGIHKDVSKERYNTCEKL